MDLYSSLTSVGPQSDYDLQLVTLNDDILSVIKSGKGNLCIKAAATNQGYPVICTDSKTYKLRQQNQSNSVMLITVDDDGHRALSFDQLPSRLILEPIPAEIITSKLHRITSLSQPLQPTHYSLAQLFEDSTASKEEFDTLLAQRQVCEIDGSCYVVDDAVLTQCLDKMLDSLIKHLIESGFEIEIMDKLTDIDVSQTKQTVWQGTGLPEPLIDLCASKFIDEGKLNHNLVVAQFGIEMLKESKQLKMDDFLINLKLKLPFNYTPDIDIHESMVGYFYTYNEGAMISYLDESLLSEEPAERFQQLFALKSQWPVHEINPFVASINHRGTKPEKFLLKYCKVRKQGTGHVATAR